MRKFVEAGHVITVSPMGNLPVMKDLVVDMAPFWDKIRAVKPYLDTKNEAVPAKEWRIEPAHGDLIHKESLCILCGCCVSECNSMESDPEFLGPAALAKAYRFVGDARDMDTRERLRDLNGAHGIWDCTRCYFCNQRCPKGVDPRDAIAKLGAESFKEGFVRHAHHFLFCYPHDCIFLCATRCLGRFCHYFIAHFSHFRRNAQGMATSPRKVQFWKQDTSFIYWFCKLRC